MERVGGAEAATAAGSVAAEGEPALALAHLEDDHDVVVARAGDLAFEVGDLAVVDHRLAGAQGRLDARLHLGLGDEAAVAGPVDGAQGAVGAGRDRKAVAAGGVGVGEAEVAAGRVAFDLLEDA